MRLMEWLPGWLAWAAGDCQGPVPEKALQRAWQRLALDIDGQRLGSGQLQVVWRQAAQGSQGERWYCRGPGACWYQATAHASRQWRGWQVRWQLQRLDDAGLRRALRGDPSLLRQVYGHRVGSRLYT